MPRLNRGMRNGLSVEPARSELLAGIFRFLGRAVPKRAGVDGHFWQHIARERRKPVCAHKNIAPGSFCLGCRIVQLTFCIQHVQNTALTNLELFNIGGARVLVVLYGFGIVVVLFLGSKNS